MQHLVAMQGVAETIGTGMNEDLLIMHCPMAFDDAGASWLQLSPKLANPYFGASMLRCGTTEGRLPKYPAKVSEQHVPAGGHGTHEH